MGIRQKVLLTFTTITLIGGLALFLVAGRELQASTLEFYQHDLQTAALNVANGLSEMMEENEGASSALQTLLERAHTIPGQTYTVLDSNRRVLASTATPRYALSSQLSYTRDIRGALEGESAHMIRKSETGEERTYVAVPITYEGRLTGILRTSAPMDRAYADARQKWIGLAAVALPILFLTMGASLWLGRTFTRPIHQLHISALRIADGAMDERVDIRSGDEIGQLGSTFNLMAERITALLATQRSFVSNAAHELRTPLMSLKLRVEALQGSTLTAQQRSAYLSELGDEIDRMSVLITQLLILARLDEGRHQADQPPTDPVAFLTDLARTWRIRASAAQLDLNVRIPPTLPDIAVAASDLQIVLDNLLSNAVKYTPPGGTIRLSAAHTAEILRIQVTDSGEGFDPTERDALFERFYRITRSRDEDVPGTGLGLAIVKAVLDHYHGTITAVSNGPDQGATFEVAFPAGA